MKRVFKYIILAASCAISLCLAYGFGVEPRRLEIRNTNLSMQGTLELPLKIALVSDIHIGGIHVSPDRVAHITKQINAQSPDLILIAGDFINGHKNRAHHSQDFNRAVDKGLENLSELSARLGVYAVLGNHDTWYDKMRIRSGLEAAGVRVLGNQSAHPRPGLCLVGLVDADTDREDPTVFNQCAPQDNIIALMHSPDSFPYLPASTMIAFAGHTHGGQINLPLLGRAVTSTHIGARYAYGQQEYGKIPVWITAGIGTSILPARFRAPPEIVILNLN